MKFILALLALTFTASAYAMPVADQNFSDAIVARAGVNFDGIIALNNCSGSIVRFYHSKQSDFALMLTNGHCTGEFIEPGKYLHNQSSARAVYILNPKTGAKMARVQASKILYGSMTKTDMAIYQLEATYEQIEKRYGVHALFMTNQQPIPGISIEVVSGYWKKNYTCALESIVPFMQEDKWKWEDSLKYTRDCHTEHGSSGSPILNTAREVIGVNNTGNDNGQRCTMDNPCEIDKNGQVSYEKGRSYGQETFWIYSCLNSAGQFNLNQPGCALFH